MQQIDGIGIPFFSKITDGSFDCTSDLQSNETTQEMVAKAKTVEKKYCYYCWMHLESVGILLGVGWIYHTWDLDPTRTAEGYC